MLTRKRYLPGATVLLVAVLAACSGPASESPDPTAPAGPVPEGLETYYSQQLDWGECAPYATSAYTQQAFSTVPEGVECARMTVPLDYSEPDGETVSLGLLRQPADDGGGEPLGSAVINPGGPGGSGMSRAAYMAQGEWDGRLAERFDLVGFDPRGVQASEPAVDCFTDREIDADRNDVDEYDGSPEAVAEAEREAREYGRQCAERTEHGEEMLANLGTRDVARDLDVLRSVLGDEKLTYIGWSYGTRIGYTYAERFPGNVRALVLDGAVDPEQDAMESLVAQYEGFGDTFDQFARWCTGREDCALGNDPAGAVGAYQDLTRPLLDRPVELPDGRVLSYEDATTGTIAALYDDQSWPMLNRGLTELAQGQGATLMMLADNYLQRGPNGRYSNMHEALTAVNCVDEPPVTDPERNAEMQRQALDAAEFLDPGLPPSSARGPCAFWPVDHTSKPRLPDVDGIPPPLVISSTGDPATPYEAGVNLAEALGGRLLTFEGARHGAFLAAGNDCIDEAGAEYLISGTLPPEGTRCGTA
ncbi:alpha/beta hydrolase [Saccharomonospora iraqiensis]|uniref:alpha/beta hydrolase n=1 Tax=Saccharomonospora iraqiensis TaxID=52698 RepID=UPI00047891D1|nr:alpha/beta hydrolase [Saccharomonospora iraqiensis]